MTTSKTVYILGAGFSIPAGGPPQEQILNEIWSLPDHRGARRHQMTLRAFLRDKLNVDERKVSLEDVFTPIDRCLADNVALRDKAQGELQAVRDTLTYLVSLAIRRKFQRGPIYDDQYCDTFARFLVGQAAIRARKAAHARSAKAAKEYDPFSIISLNWDILLDNALDDALRRQDRGLSGDYEPFGVIDYCCYVSSYNEDEQRIRSGLWSLGCRGYNVKFLKIHGSMNWLQCSNCQRLFVGFGEKLSAINFTTPTPCRHCGKHNHEAFLRGSLVMPTFLKDLSNFQIKVVWQNAGVELMEARKLVFIGYSLPHADFEFRQLLSRMVHKNASVHVVLFRKDGDKKSAEQYEQACQRYSQFFSTRTVGDTLTFEPGGVVAFVNKLCR